jgi:hypothetical protein
LHRFQRNHIFIAARGSKNREQPLTEAVSRGTKRFEEKWNTHVHTYSEVQIHDPSGEPCLSVIDYMNWAVYRAFTRGEMGYFDTVRDRVSLLVDHYDTRNYGKNWYSKKNPFQIEKATPL